MRQLVTLQEGIDFLTKKGIRNSNHPGRQPTYHYLSINAYKKICSRMNSPVRDFMHYYF